MANQLFNAVKGRWLGIDTYSGLTQPDFSSTSVSTFRASLIDTGTFNPVPTTHTNYSQVSGVVASGNLTSPTCSFSGSTATFDAADIVFSAVSGSSAEELIIDCNTGTASTSILIVDFDTATGLPVTPNGGDITITFSVSGIFSI